MSVISEDTQSQLSAWLAKVQPATESFVGASLKDMRKLIGIVQGYIALDKYASHGHLVQCDAWPISDGKGKPNRARCSCGMFEAMKELHDIINDASSKRVCCSTCGGSGYMPPYNEDGSMNEFERCPTCRNSNELSQVREGN